MKSGLLIFYQTAVHTPVYNCCLAHKAVEILDENPSPISLTRIVNISSASGLRKVCEQIDLYTMATTTPAPNAINKNENESAIHQGSRQPSGLIPTFGTLGFVLRLFCFGQLSR